MENQNKYKKIIYITIGILIISLLAINIMLNNYSKKMETKVSDMSTKENLQNNQIAQVSSEIGSNEENSNINNIIDETLKENEILKNNNVDLNKEINVNNNESNKNNTNKNEEQDKNIDKNQTQLTNSDIQNNKVELNFSMPVKGDIVKEYAKDKLVYSNTLEEWTTHLGIDIKADKTTIVKSIENGIVKSIKNDPRYGITVIISHDNGFESQYSNLLTAEFIAEGEEIKKEQTIGTIGNTAIFEIEDDPHLHFELRKNDENVDPTVYLK